MIDVSAKDYSDFELIILAAVGELVISKLKGHDDVAYAIFNELVPRYVGRYPHHKILTHLVLQHVHEETPEELEARLRQITHPELLAKPDGLPSIFETGSEE